MQFEKIFRTKTGYCHVLPQKIAFTRDGILGNLTEKSTGARVANLFAVYGLIALFLLYQAITSYQTNHTFQATFFGLLSGYLFVGILRSRNNTAVQSIARENIQKVKFKKATSLSRAYFEVFYKDEENRTKKRLILLPGSASDGTEEIDRATKIFKEENLIK
ncbi:hypothetical protein [Rufibacter roseus]|uniref:Phosphoribosylaminoimidazolesuccinocarboxamide synthase n=1 Tax=Rufibacter roseus TaxID=1567108 RepID=A0ABW2DJH9_9BACT|nr:hypothetical protein [Rufibacter roseus]